MKIYHNVALFQFFWPRGKLPLGTQIASIKTSQHNEDKRTISSFYNINKLLVVLRSVPHLHLLDICISCKKI